MLKIEYINIDEIKPYAKNAKLHPDEQVEQIAKSIREFGFNDPIALWHGEIVEGHGRYLAAKKMAIHEVPVIRLDELTDEQRRAYMLVHNKLTMNSGFDIDILNDELSALSFDMTDFGFENALEDDDGDGYTGKTDIPQYEPSENGAVLYELCDTGKADSLVADIEASDVTDEEKKFLKFAAMRHNVFNYKKIADYYAKATPEMQRLMEASALVIIDYENAIANGYVRLTERLRGMCDEI